MTKELLEFYREFTELKKTVERLEKEIKKYKPKTSRFIKPTLEEVAQAFKDKGYQKKHAESFISHYESNGWKVGKNSMKNWKATVAQWCTRMKEKGLRPDDYTYTAPKKQTQTHTPIEEVKTPEKKDPLGVAKAEWKIIQSGEAEGLKRKYPDCDLCKTFDEFKELRDNKSKAFEQKNRSEEAQRKFDLAEKVAQDAKQGFTSSFQGIK